MVNKQTTGSLERPNEKNGVKDGTIRNNFATNKSHTRQP